MLKLKGFSFASLLLKLSVALRRPLALGSNLTEKVVLPPGVTLAAGAAVTVKSAACVPPTVTLPRVSVALPGLVMVKVRTRVSPGVPTLPKSV